MASFLVATRFWIWCLLFGLTALVFMLQSIMPIALLAMKQMSGEAGVKQPDFGPRYAYTPYEQSLILGAYYMGALVGVIPIGLLLDRFDCVRWYILGGYLLAGTLQLVTPFAAPSAAALIALRAIVGVTQSATYPAAHKLISRWAPSAEMGRFTIALFGSNVGTIGTLAISGAVIERWGWAWTFWASTLAVAVYAALWWWHGWASPAQHPRLAEAERWYIEESRPTVARKTSRVPLWRIITSVPVWCLIVLQFGNAWGFYFLVNSAPRYVSEVLGFTIGNTGLLASLPYICRLLGAALFGLANDWAHQHDGMSRMNRRRLFSVCSHIVPGLLVAGIPFVGTDATVCVAMMTVAYGFNGAITQSSMANNHDLTPNFAASVWTIANIFGYISGFISPVVVTWLTLDQDVTVGWRNVFLLGAGIYIVPAVLFMCLGSASVQPWDSDAAVILTDAVGTDAVVEPLRTTDVTT